MRITICHSVSLRRIETYEVPDALGLRLIGQEDCSGFADTGPYDDEAWELLYENHEPDWSDDDEQDAILTLVEEQQPHTNPQR